MHASAASKTGKLTTRNLPIFKIVAVISGLRYGAYERIIAPAISQPLPDSNGISPHLRQFYAVALINWSSSAFGDRCI